MKTLLVLLVALALLIGVAPLRPAYALVPVEDCDQTCSVNRNCSSTGLSCSPDDRECASAAVARGLEVKCEQECATGKRFTYCPPSTGRSDDSGYVWVLLMLAGGLGVGGGIVAYLALRKKA